MQQEHITFIRLIHTQVWWTVMDTRWSVTIILWELLVWGWHFHGLLLMHPASWSDKVQPGSQPFNYEMHGHWCLSVMFWDSVEQNAPSSSFPLLYLKADRKPEVFISFHECLQINSERKGFIRCFPAFLTRE